MCYRIFFVTLEHLYLIPYIFHLYFIPYIFSHLYLIPYIFEPFIPYTLSHAAPLIGGSGGAARFLTRKQEFFIPVCLMSLIYVMLYCAKISKCFHRLLILLKVKKSLVCVTVHSLSAGGTDPHFWHVKFL